MLGGNLNDMHFSAFNLNLLRVFDAVMEERSVTRAASRVGLSPSAVSHGLNRLRSKLGDQLFVREKDQMRPTPFAEEIATEIHASMLRLRLLLEQEEFLPSESNRTFTIAASDFSSALIVPHLLKSVLAEAPNVEVRILSTAIANVANELDAGRVDFSIGIFVDAAPRFRSQFLCDVDRVYVTNCRFPKNEMTLQDLAELPHIVITLSNHFTQIVIDNCVVEPGLRRNVNIGGIDSIDHELAKYRLRRRIAAVVPHPLAVPMILQQIDAVAMLPRAMAEAAAAVYDLKIFKDPCSNTPVPMSLIWHERADADKGMSWFRELMADLPISRDA